jgi:hypothetical protein
LLWYQPTVVERTGITVLQVPGEFGADVAKGRDEPTVADARDYVARIRAKIASTTTTTTAPGTSTTSTTRAGAGIGGNIDSGDATTSSSSTSSPTSTP